MKVSSWLRAAYAYKRLQLATAQPNKPFHFYKENWSVIFRCYVMYQTIYENYLNMI